MYNLIVAAQDDAWVESPYSLEKSRLGEYTPAALRARYTTLSNEVITELQSFPTLFAYEQPMQQAARLGRVTRVAQPSGRDLRFQFKLFEQVPPISHEKVAELAWELDVGEWELNRTHWAVKDIDLLDVMTRAGLLHDDQIPTELVNASTSSTETITNLPIRPTVFALPVGEQQQDLVAVMMPFDPDFNGVFSAIENACRNANLQCTRADRIWEASTVVQDIFALIYRSRIVVADLTGSNPNVMYEVGIAHTLGRPVVPIVQAPATRPFDIAHHRILDYLPDPVGLAAMTARLSQRLHYLA